MMSCRTSSGVWAMPSGAPTTPSGERAVRREQRMLDGLAELDRWLADQIRSGLVGADRAGYAAVDAVAARMVDAQLPAVASVLRRLAGVASSGDDWPERLLEEYALLHLLARAAPAALREPGPFAATVREHLGVPVPRAEVLAGPAHRDRWVVLALRDELEERLVARRVWLQGHDSGRSALVLTFAMPGQDLDASLAPGTVVDADVHFYPGALPLRALVGARHGPAQPVSRGPGRGAVWPVAVGLDAALAAWAAALAADPWLRAWPVVLGGVVPVLGDGAWWLVDDDGALPMVTPVDEAWVLLAASGGHPMTLLAEIVPSGVRPVALLHGGEPGASG